MSAAQALPPPTEEFNAAKRHYVEQFGAALVSNSYLKITVVCLTTVSIALVLLNIRHLASTPRIEASHYPYR